MFVKNRMARQWLSGIFAAALLLSFLTIEEQSAVADGTLSHIDRGAFNSSDQLTGDWKVQSGSYKARNLDAGLVGGTPGVALDVTRNYHVFDLTGTIGVASSATLEIFMPTSADGGGDGYISGNPNRTVSFWDVTISPAELLAGNGASNPGAVHPDLGTGTGYGSVSVSAADNGQTVSIPLNASALADINAAIGLGTWSVGGSIELANPMFVNGVEQVFNGSGTSAPDANLVLTGRVWVPEPTSFVLAGVALVSLGGMTRRRR